MIARARLLARSGCVTCMLPTSAEPATAAGQRRVLEWNVYGANSQRFSGSNRVWQCPLERYAQACGAPCDLRISHQHDCVGHQAGLDQITCSRVWSLQSLITHRSPRSSCRRLDMSQTRQRQVDRGSASVRVWGRGRSIGPRAHSHEEDPEGRKIRAIGARVR
jgi:hypothetical protein